MKRAKLHSKDCMPQAMNTVTRLSAAAIFGWFAGENAAQYVREITPEADPSKVKTEIEARNHFLDEILSRDEGVTWQEVVVAVQQVMQDYAGTIKSESGLKAGSITCAG